MGPSKHVIISFSAGVVLWFFTRSFYAGLLCFASGVLIDLDHILEFAIHHDWKNFTIKNLYEACEHTMKQEGERRFTRSYLIFHAVEIILLLWIAVIYIKNIYLFAFTLGYSLHIILDYIGNPVYFHSYFIFSRVLKKFKTEKIFKKR